MSCFVYEEKVLCCLCGDICENAQRLKCGHICCKHCAATVLGRNEVRCIARNTAMDEAEVCVLCGFCGEGTMYNELECDVEIDCITKEKRNGTERPQGV